jgi:uncharacterized protein (TIGR03437 family)
MDIHGSLRLTLLSALFLFLSSPASAIITLGTSAQNFVLTGIGPNASGQGQSKMGWGSCTYDGTNTTCTLSGPYTGLGKGGTYNFVVSYAGNGPFPLNAITPPGSDLFTAQATGPLDFHITLAETGGATINLYSFANFSFQYASPICTGSPSTCSVGQVGQTPNATISGPITGLLNPAPVISPNGVISAGNYGAFPAVAPGTWIEIYGVNLATTRSQTWAGSDFNGVQAPTALGGTTVTVAGKPAYIDFVTPGQVNVQVPSGIAAGQQSIVITTAGGASLPYVVNVNATLPGLLAPPAFNLSGKQYVAALVANTLTFVLPVNVSGVSTTRVKPGDTITLYGIGFGPVTPDIAAGQIVQQNNALQAALKVTIGGVQANVTYAGLAPNYVGLYQFNVVIPQVPAGDAVSLAFSLGGAGGTQNLVIPIAN